MQHDKQTQKKQQHENRRERFADPPSSYFILEANNTSVGRITNDHIHANG